MTVQPSHPHRRGYMVDISLNPWGFFDARVVRADVEEAIADYLTPCGQRWIGVNVDGDEAIAKALADFRLTLTEVAVLKAGWTVRKLATIDTLLAYIGCNADANLSLPA